MAARASVRESDTAVWRSAQGAPERDNKNSRPSSWAARKGLLMRNLMAARCFGDACDVEGQVDDLAAAINSSHEVMAWIEPASMQARGCVQDREFAHASERGSPFRVVPLSFHAQITASGLSIPKDSSQVVQRASSTPSRVAWLWRCVRPVGLAFECQVRQVEDSSATCTIVQPPSRGEL